MNLKNKTIIKLLFLVVAVFLIGGYLYYDFQRYQELQSLKNLEEEINVLKLEMADFRRETVSPSTEESIIKDEFIKLRGMIRKIEDEIIILQGVVIPLNEETLLDSSESKEYRVTVNSETSIQQQNQEINLADLKQGEEGDPVLVTGRANPFDEQEVVAETIFVLRE